MNIATEEKRQAEARTGVGNCHKVIMLSNSSSHSKDFGAALVLTCFQNRSPETQKSVISPTFFL